MTPTLASGRLTAELNDTLGWAMLHAQPGSDTLSPGLVSDLLALLAHWAVAPNIQTVVLVDQSTGPSAGLDGAFMAHAALHDHAALRGYIEGLSQLTLAVERFPKPLMALMGGMAAGVAWGIQLGAKLRVVNEATRLMPVDPALGLMAGAGVAWHLAQATGAHADRWARPTQGLSGSEAMALGLADVYVPRAAWDDLLGALTHGPQPHAEHSVATVMERVELLPDAAPNVDTNVGHRGAETSTPASSLNLQLLREAGAGALSDQLDRERALLTRLTRLGAGETANDWLRLVPEGGAGEVLSWQWQPAPPRGPFANG